MARDRALTLLAATALGLSLVACERTPTPTSLDAPPRTSGSASAADGFSVELQLSEAAARVVAGEGPTLDVVAEWFGYPTVAAQQRQVPGTEQPWLELHRETRPLREAGEVRFGSPDIAADRLALIEQGRPHLRVSVAERDDGADDGGALLDCGAFQGRLTAALREGVTLHCSLATE